MLNEQPNIQGTPGVDPNAFSVNWQDSMYNFNDVPDLELFETGAIVSLRIVSATFYQSKTSGGYSLKILSESLTSPERYNKIVDYLGFPNADDDAERKANKLRKFKSFHAATGITNPPTQILDDKHNIYVGRTFKASVKIDNDDPQYGAKNVITSYMKAD